MTIRVSAVITGITRASDASTEVRWTHHWMGTPLTSYAWTTGWTDPATGTVSPELIRTFGTPSTPALAALLARPVPYVMQGGTRVPLDTYVPGFDDRMLIDSTVPPRDMTMVVRARIVAWYAAVGVTVLAREIALANRWRVAESDPPASVDLYRGRAVSLGKIPNRAVATTPDWLGKRGRILLPQTQRLLRVADFDASMLVLRLLFKTVPFSAIRYMLFAFAASEYQPETATAGWSLPVTGVESHNDAPDPRIRVAGADLDDAAHAWLVQRSECLLMLGAYRTGTVSAIADCGLLRRATLEFG